MQRRRRRQVREERLEAIDGFEPQEFGDLGDPAWARRRQADRQRVPALVQKPVNVTQQAGQRRRGAAIQHRRNVALIEHDAVVGAPLDHLGDAEGGVRGGDVGFLQELQPEPADLDQRRAIERRVAVLDLELAGDVARQAVRSGPAEVGFVRARPPDRQGQRHERVAQGGGNVQRRRQRIPRRAVEGRPVREHAARGAQRQLAELQ